MFRVAVFAVALAVTAPALAIDGTYTGKGRDVAYNGSGKPIPVKWNLFADIKPTADGNHSVRMAITGENCVSDFEATGALRGNVLDVAGSCPVRITQAGRSITVKEIGRCEDHNLMCTFEGKLTRSR